MCDLDYDFYATRIIMVTTRKKHRCQSCDTHFPAGTRMEMLSGQHDGGLLGNSFKCETCVLLTDETYEGTALHICEGDLDQEENAWERYEYVQWCLAEGEPVIMAVLELIRDGFLKDEVMA